MPKHRTLLLLYPSDSGVYVIFLRHGPLNLKNSNTVTQFMSMNSIAYGSSSLLVLLRNNVSPKFK
jgi:hypothetical protein